MITQTSIDRAVNFFDRALKTDEERLALVDIMLNTRSMDDELLAVKKVILSRMAEKALLGTENETSG